MALSVWHVHFCVNFMPEYLHKIKIYNYQFWRASGQIRHWGWCVCVCVSWRQMWGILEPLWLPWLHIQCALRCMLSPGIWTWPCGHWKPVNVPQSGSTWSQRRACSWLRMACYFLCPEDMEGGLAPTTLHGAGGLEVTPIQERRWETCSRPPQRLSVSSVCPSSPRLELREPPCKFSKYCIWLASWKICNPQRIKT